METRSEKSAPDPQLARFFAWARARAARKDACKGGDARLQPNGLYWCPYCDIDYRDQEQAELPGHPNKDEREGA